MLIEGTELLGNKVQALEDGAYLGTIRTLIIDPKNGRLLAALVGKGNFGGRKFLPILDMIDFSLDKVYVKNEGVLLEPKDLVRANEILIKRIQVLRMKAFTKKGEYLGRVDDVLFDTNTGMIEKFYIGHNIFMNFFYRGIIVPKSRIEKITKKKVIVCNDVCEKEKAAEKAIA